MLEVREEKPKTPIRSFTDLMAWQETYKLTLDVYKVTQNFPASENFGLTSQMRRASVSGVSNIAEGFGRSTSKDREHFYQMASGSLHELKSQMLVAQGLHYVSETEYDSLLIAADQAHRLLNGLLRSHKSNNKFTNLQRLTSNV